jgi:AcrR family transcriptional regulator
MSQEIHRTALVHFAAGGVDSVSLADIAEAAGVELSVVLEAYGNADALFTAAVTTALRPLNVELAVLADDSRPPGTRLLMMVRRLATPVANEGTALFAVMREVLDGNPRSQTAFETAMHDGFETFVRVIGEAQFRGDIRPLPPRFIMSVLLSGIVFPQLIGFGGAEGTLKGVHARTEEQQDGDPMAPPRSALLAASIEAVFNGISASGTASTH